MRLIITETIMAASLKVTQMPFLQYAGSERPGLIRHTLTVTSFQAL
jgi:hypothetical protein